MRFGGAFKHRFWAVLQMWGVLQHEEVLDLTPHGSHPGAHCCCVGGRCKFHLSTTAAMTRRIRLRRRLRLQRRCLEVLRVLPVPWALRRLPRHDLWHPRGPWRQMPQGPRFLHQRRRRGLYHHHGQHDIEIGVQRQQYRGANVVKMVSFKVKKRSGKVGRDTFLRITTFFHFFLITILFIKGSPCKTGKKSSLVILIWSSSSFSRSCFVKFPPLKSTVEPCQVIDRIDGRFFLDRIDRKVETTRLYLPGGISSEGPQIDMSWRGREIVTQTLHKVGPTTYKLGL